MGAMISQSCMYMKVFKPEVMILLHLSEYSKQESQKRDQKQATKEVSHAGIVCMFVEITPGLTYIHYVFWEGGVD